jgi:hypothetical protein
MSGKDFQKSVIGSCGNASSYLSSRVARWFIFKPKIPIWVNFGGPYIGKCLYILWPFGIFYGHLGYFYDHSVHFVFHCYIFTGFGKEKIWQPCKATFHCYFEQTFRFGQFRIF